MTAPDPAALLAAMEAAAQDYREQCLPEITLLTDDLAALCAAFRASQEREAAAVAELDAYRIAAMYDAKMEGAVFSHWNRSQLDRARLMSEAAIKAEGDKP